MKIPSKVKIGWEHRFPDLSGERTHWKIIGDGDYIDVINGMELLKALETVENNFGKFASIKVCRASVDDEGKIFEEEKALFEISNYFYDERNCTIL